MSQLPSILNRLESRLQTLVEGSLGRLFPAYDLRQALAHHLVTAMQGELRLDTREPLSEENLISPDQFTIFLPSEQADIALDRQDLVKELARGLQRAAQASRIRFLNPPTVRILPSPENELEKIQVVAQFSLVDLTSTSTLAQAAVTPLAVEVPAAFLIVDGVRTFHVTEALVNIGRQEDNHLVIDDPRVSRHHAQLRFTQGRFMLFDLGSTGGTFINAVQITRHLLVSGDVISLGGVPLIFGLEPGKVAHQTQSLGIP